MITVTGQPPATRIKVDGWLDGEGATELLRVVDSVASTERLLLHDLRGADADGVSLLRRLANRGVTLDGLSPYVALMVADAAGRESRETPGQTRSDTPLKRREDA